MGEVRIQGSKNGALPLMTATLLIQGKTILHNCPDITDIRAMADLLQTIGCVVNFDRNTMTIDATHICDTHCPQKQVQAMRSSIMLLGPLLGRCKSVRMHKPGGCVIGERPTDIHEQALGRMNVQFVSDKDTITARTECLKGAEIQLPFPSVGATENIMMAAVTADGITKILNAAKEPEICMLSDFLMKAGAKIKGAGTSVIEIVGVSDLREVTMSVPPDRIVAGTYLMAAVATGGQILLRNAPSEHMKKTIDILRQTGAGIFADQDMIYIDAEEKCRALPYVKTEVYPGFPTDLQSMLLAALALSEGESMVEESIFEDRFRIVPELCKMGADIRQEHNRVRIRGVKKLSGDRLTACELRGGAALVIAALAAQGESRICGCDFIERGYEDIVRDIRKLGGDIRKVTGEKDVSI